MKKIKVSRKTNSTYMNIDLINPKWVGFCWVCTKSWLIHNRKQICLCPCERKLRFKKWKRNTSKQNLWNTQSE